MRSHGFIRHAIAAAVCVLASTGAASASGPAGKLPDVVANDNTRAAGQRHGDVVTIRLRAAEGLWRPEGDAGPALRVEALGEEGDAPMVPAPLLRVAAGATLAVTVRNTLPTPLRLHGFCSRNDTPCPPMDVPPGAVRDVRFAAGQPGTYHYWATSIGAPMPFREMAGAFVIDAAAVPAAPDRIFAITEWTSLTAGQLRDIVTADDPNETFLAATPQVLFVINGRSWPATERLRYPRGEPVRWRVLNLSSQTHPFHLHGFYFRVVRTGNGLRDGAVRPSTGREVVTEVLRTGETMDLEWTPEREGNWLFHCHVMSHVWPARQLHGDAARPMGAELVPSSHAHAGAGHAAHDPSLGMAGMVLGITVTPGRSPAPDPVSDDPPRHVRLVLGADRARGVAYGVAIAEDASVVEPSRLTSPGPVLRLQRGRPVQITVENRLAEPTSIHWHGLELDSFYDGVHGWSGAGARTAPMIPPGGEFVVRLTPPRAGTFIYHTHLHDYRQLSAGLYGAVVVDDGARADPDADADHVVVLGRRDASEATGIIEDGASIVLNGERDLRVRWRAGRTHRLRLVNITPDDLLQVALTRRGGELVTWRLIAKDGATLDPSAVVPSPSRLELAVGETMDVEVDVPPGPGQWWIEVRATSGRWQAQGRVLLR